MSRDTLSLKSTSSEVVGVSLQMTTYRALQSFSSPSILSFKYSVVSSILPSLQPIPEVPLCHKLLSFTVASYAAVYPAWCNMDGTSAFRATFRFAT